MRKSEDRATLLQQQTKLFEECKGCEKRTHTNVCKACPIGKKLTRIGKQLQASNRNEQQVNMIVEQVNDEGLTTETYYALRMYGRDKDIVEWLNVPARFLQRWKSVCITHKAYYEARITPELFFELHEQGYSAKKISAIVGITEKELSDWRSANELGCCYLKEYPRFKKFKRFDRYRERFGRSLTDYLQWVRQQKKELARRKREEGLVLVSKVGYSELDVFLETYVFVQMHAVEQLDLEFGFTLTVVDGGLKTPKSSRPRKRRYTPIVGSEQLTFAL